MKYKWFGHLGGRGMRFPRMGILPEIFDGREYLGEAQECHTRGGNEISHGCGTPGPPTNQDAWTIDERFRTFGSQDKLSTVGRET